MVFLSACGWTRKTWWSFGGRGKSHTRTWKAPVWVNPEVNAFICGAGCVVHLGGTISSQGEVAVGPVLRF